MVTWHDALQRIDAGGPHDLGIRPGRLWSFRRIPLAIAGTSGAGKTRLWSALTGHPERAALSLTTDDGYLLRPNSTALTLTTIPGQESRSRYFALEELFGRETILRGVVFLAERLRPHLAGQRRLGCEWSEAVRPGVTPQTQSRRRAS